MRILSKMRNWFLHAKFYISRATSYLAIINAGMLLFILLDGMDNVDLEAKNYFIPIFLFTLFFLLLVGFIDVRYFKGYQSETTIVYKLNPLFQELREKVDYLYQLKQGEENENSRN